MNFDLDESQFMLRDNARNLFSNECPPKVVREAMEKNNGFASELWNVVAEAGWLGLTIPEKYGGAELSPLDLAVVLEQAGRAIAPIPLWSEYLATSAILALGSEEQKQSLLPDLAEGKRIAVLAATEADGTWTFDEVGTKLSESSGGFEISGTKVFIPDAHIANLLLAPAKTADGSLALAVVPTDATGVSVQILPGFDLTRRLCEVKFDKVQVPASSVMRGDVRAALAKVRYLGAAALAAEMLGGANACLDMAVDYAKVRYTFSRALGSYQSIKHRLAEMLGEIDGSRSLVMFAAWAAEADPQQLPVAAAAAKSYCADTFCRASRENIQIHGGIGFTWEHDAHMYYKRAKLDDLLLGTGHDFREELVQALEAASPAAAG
jgi:alkylation response protein AidB-like acyl-CoA dehydrogenase